MDQLRSWVSTKIGHQGEGFFLDNELGRHRVFFGSFLRFQSLLCTNGEIFWNLNQGRGSKDPIALAMMKGGLW